MTEASQNASQAAPLSPPGTLKRIARLPLLGMAYIAWFFPLTEIGVTRSRWYFLAAFPPIALLALTAQRRVQRPWLRLVLLRGYLATCVLLLVATRNVLLSIDEIAFWRALGAATAIAALALAHRQLSRQRPDLTRRPRWMHGLALAVIVAAILRLSWLGLFTNPGIVPALFIVAALLHFRLAATELLTWTACSVAVLYNWLGFMNACDYTGQVDPSPPAGIEIQVLQHGNPVQVPGARYFQPGRCPSTEGAFYMGEGGRTYRLNRDGSETVLFDSAESSQNLIELCDEGLIVTGSFEQKFLFFGDLRTGAQLARLPLPSHPTQLVLSPDRSTLYLGSSMPAILYRIDVATRSVTTTIDRYRDVDPGFSGICNILLIEDRILGVYSSWYMANPRAGEVFSTDLDLAEMRTHGSFMGAWGFIAGDAARPRTVYLQSYDWPPLYRIDLPSPPQEIAALPRGYLYLADVPEAGLLVTNHWTTGDLLAICKSDPSRRYTVRMGGMGRMLHVRGNQVFTPTAAGHVTVTFPPGLCS